MTPVSVRSGVRVCGCYGLRSISGRCESHAEAKGGAAGGAARGGAAWGEGERGS